MKKILKIYNAFADKLKIGAIVFGNVKVESSIAELNSQIDDLATQLQSKFPTPAAANTLFSDMRHIYRQLGIDPTKTRPSSEALIRRALQRKTIYLINSIVDICNYCSIYFGLSIGLYDVDKICGEKIEIRLGQNGEGYAGIGKQYVNLEARIALVDRQGPFGNPSSDSDRTKITLESKRVMFIIFAPFDYEQSKMHDHLDFVETTVKKYHNCQIEFKQIITG
ncbi:MAG: phenylalanine--tRNA ligase beta subunit-related protein [bacterium]|nr:phenylalanine--tRNA ligase beta subunit-related protein [bacterium]